MKETPAERLFDELMHYGKVIYRKDFDKNGNCYTVRKIEYNNKVYKTLQSNGELIYIA